MRSCLLLLKSCLLLLLMSITLFATAQQNVGIGTGTPNNSAMLDVNSTNKGMLMPRLTTAQRKGIAQPALGLLVFDTDKGTLMFFDGNAWRALAFTDENKTPAQSRASQEPAANSGFGTRVSISGDYAIIGAPRFSESGLSYMGLAYIFNKTSNGWTQVARLAAKDSAVNAYFGGSVAISGDYAIVGSCNKQVNANVAQGKAYVYRRNGANWLLDTAFTKPGGAAYDDFGWSVGICAFNTGGPGVAIGIPYSDAGGAG